MFGHVWPTYRTRFQQSMVCIPMLCSFSMPFCFFKAWFKPWRSLAIGGDWRPDQVPSEITLRCWAWIWGELSHSSTLQSVMSRPTSLSWQPTEVNKSPCLASFFWKTMDKPINDVYKMCFSCFFRCHISKVRMSWFFSDDHRSPSSPEVRWWSKGLCGRSATPPNRLDEDGSTHLILMVVRLTNDTLRYLGGVVSWLVAGEKID